MKLPKLFLSIFIASVIFSQSLYSQNGYLKDKFHVGIFCPYPWDGRFHDATNYGYYHDLSLNAMQTYGFHKDNDATNRDGGFLDPLSSYSTTAGDIINSWYSTGNYNQRGMVVEREKILRPAFGQRSTYQVEYNADNLLNKIIRPGYGYEESDMPQNTIIDDYWGSATQRVRFCQTNTNQSGYIVKKLYENYEQVNISTSGETGNGHNHFLNRGVGNIPDTMNKKGSGINIRAFCLLMLKFLIKLIP